MGIKRGFQNLMISLLEKRWPGLKEVVKIIGKRVEYVCNSS